MCAPARLARRAGSWSTSEYSWTRASTSFSTGTAKVKWTGADVTGERLALQGEPGSEARSDQSDSSPSAMSRGPLWSVATLVLGAILWVQLFWLGVDAEMRFSEPRPWALLAYFLPLIMLFAGVWSRAPVILLTLFAGSLLPGLVLLAEPERLMLMEGGSMVRVGGAFALFLAIASAGSGSELDSGDISEMAREQSPVDAELRRFVLARLVVLVLLWCVPAYAVYLDPAIAGHIMASYGDSTHVGQVFLGVVHFFIWSVGAYMMVLVPALNVEYDRRRLKRELRQYLRGWGWRDGGLRMALYVGIALVGGILVFALR